MSTPTWADVLQATEAVHPFVRRTPVLRAEVDGRPLVLKLEHLQRSGSFKLRGAVNALVSGPLPERVLTASGGNHGLGVATAASLLNLPATVYVPESAPQAKTDRIEAAGAKLIRHGATYAEAAAKALEASSEPGTRYLHAYDDPAVIAGQGTVAAEVIQDAPDVDAFLVAVGGGGLVAGTSLAGLPTFAVEPERCRALGAALEAGGPVDVEIDSVAASALGATRIGSVPFGVLRDRVTSVLVSDAELLAARDRLWEEFRLAVEPAAAVPFAAWLAGRTEGELPCVILCGANSEWTP
ncbi:serine/threonine dehydratase [Amycolatopsis sp. BJA-103]|uniref:serine/threonine dehydratase n=1 Tax=Amycolatopsis sp. BJA-103 TaxID=1911175 RepID=UPI000C776C2B|nr:serine/threonine dehydratase [Amycolatopsis sp. BJA-103]AUI62284.1 threonine dehydratase [Amycolatopsis sp. BJA-103]PNE20409.1 threonine dehydratase [Amycolatopsis sp. BJA-103]